MKSADWIEFLGRSSEDKPLLAALTKAGIKKIPPIKPGRLDTRVELGDVMLIFSDGELYPDIVDGGDGISVLSSVILPIKNQKWGTYTGVLPLALDREDSQVKLRGRFGEPLAHDEDFRWDEWKVGEHVLRVEYTEDYKSLESFCLSLPEPA
jgi:hypothetical protein